MKKLNSIAEVKTHFECTLQKGLVAIYKTANRAVLGQGTKRIPFVLYVPEKGISASEYLELLEKQGENPNQLFRMGIDLYFRSSIPANLDGKASKPKNMPAGFLASFIATLSPEELVKQQASLLTNAETAWKNTPASANLDFCFVDEALSKELTDSANAIMENLFKE